MTWNTIIRDLRKDYIKEAKTYVEEVMPHLDFNKTKEIKKNTSDFISKMYLNSYNKYLQDEQIVNKEIIENLLITDEAKSFFKDIAKPPSTIEWE